ncbi:MAG: Rrf2 family transcriptional regulator [Candidatus Jacksonbacteria bacterium]|jgi:Rrf2 family protein|nr:Rrf2 family transcriptional regulator [Candidatus Jacksonbacteria bacterium]MBT6034464.1 Rrf2 family transcriptional regulator [Candidatus Jacksonbacteria bacterium]MBT6301583.1 Rrf2 family transcriptional regulator [Candidatus Jacksonbacteria bacterium]MBT6756999.1 Rrf2 family transcriptional regulator [Candidatus Jacksonbacteria bacterium]MBT6954931.1 Rrf2 family transcriptional regulator [Candidatus Jacksonbacteria bacterium]
MLFSTKAHYAVVLLSALAKADKSLSLRLVAKEHGLPYEYLEKIAQELKKGGFVVSSRGASGGYSLAKKAQHIKISDVVKEVEHVKSNIRNCTKQNVCDCRKASCDKKVAWNKVEKNVWESLSKVVLKDLI